MIWLRAALGLSCLLALLALLPVEAGAHMERKVTFPSGTGSVPVYRMSGPHLVVCPKTKADFEGRIANFAADLKAHNRQLWDECAFTSLQDAVDHVRRSGEIIYLLPGVYTEEASLAPLPARCSHLIAPWNDRWKTQILSYEQQSACPHNQNLVAILGVKDLQVEGTGASPLDVVVDGQFRKVNAIRADRTDGVYFRNFTVERSTGNALYILQSDGFVIDHMLGRWNNEYGFLTFADDHGLYTNCEAYGNGDSGIYPGGTSDINKDRGFSVPRYAIEVTQCRAHHNLVGYSGTGGDSVHVHDSEFDANTIGATMDSVFPNHPGLPQNHALLENNRIHGNNQDYYRFVRDGTCRKPYAQRGIETGTICPAVGPPVGTGVLVGGGNYDTFRNNWVYDNWRYGFVLLWVPAFVHNDWTLAHQFNTSNYNRFTGNSLGVAPGGKQLPNGLDFWWDGQGEGNCWEAGYFASDPVGLPGCGSPSPAFSRYLPDLGKILYGLNCSSYDLPSFYIPAGCDWFQTPARPGSLTWSWRAFGEFGTLIGLVIVLLISRRTRRPGSPPRPGRRPRRPRAARSRPPAALPAGRRAP